MRCEELVASGRSCPIFGSGTLMDFEAQAFDAERPTHVSIVECAACHFAWQYPWGHTVEESVNWFSDAYSHGAETKSSYFSLDSKRKIAELELDFVKRLPVTRRTLLDIGAGAGVFARTAGEEGWSVTAVDPALDLRYLSYHFAFNR